MRRLEKYKHRRNLRQKYISAVLLFFLLLAAGISTVDYSTNYLLSGQRSLEFFEINNYTQGIEVIFMNQKLYINTQYIKRDLNNLKSFLDNSFR